MPVEKILLNIRAQMKEIEPMLEGFSNGTVQPGVEDCALLQKKLHDLLEQLAIYKYNKQIYELSPSFNLHAHISEAAEAVKQEAIPPQDPPPAMPPVAEKKESARNGGQHAIKPLQIGLNDKFRFINELFAHNDAEYNIAVEQLSNLQSWSETDLYLNSLKNLYGWRDNHDAVKYFYSLVKRRFQ